jgi:hypothetical protein
VPFNGTSSDGGTTIIGQSTVSSNTASSTISGGLQLFSMSCVSGNSETIDITSQDLLLFPGDTITFAVYASSSVATVGISISWTEDI